MPWITNSLTSIVLSPLVGCLVGSSHVLLGSGSDYGCVEYKWGYMRWSYICFAFSVGRSWTSVNHWKFPTTTNKNLQMLVAAPEDWSWWGPLSGWLDLVGFLWTGYPFHEKSKQILIIKDGSFPQVQLPPIVVVHFCSLFFVACQGRGNFLLSRIVAVHDFVMPATLVMTDWNGWMSGGNGWRRDEMRLEPSGSLSVLERLLGHFSS